MIDVPVLSIDVSKSKSVALIFKRYQEPLSKPFSFLHSPRDMSRLTEKLITLEFETGKRPHVVMEATGNYSKPIMAYFQDAGYKVVVLNPLQTHAEKKKSVRKIKTDPIDANRIAQVYYLNEFTVAKPVEDHILELQNLCRQYDGFNTLYTETQLRLRSVLDLLFPKFESVFSHLCSPTALRVLSSFPSPAAILSATRDQIMECLKPAKKSQRWNELKTDELILAAKESLPYNRAQQSNIRVLRMYIELLLSQQNILTDIRAQMVYWANFSPDYPLLRSIPGVGEATATTILAEIGDIKRFPSAKQWVAFAGVDPSVFESGKFKSSHNKISKRGSPFLRKAIYQATVAGISNRVGGPLNPTLSDFYLRKIDEGKAGKVAIIATTNKMLRMIYGILSSQQPFSTSK
ncbi:IS110 family transposase [Desulfitobacterium sp. Sab5]|uniref:IS110 family transposase n=1 Tax=Desulfitobacterium nosdiversum TaxID=3375356 RepID=UPI003CFAD923